MYVAYCCGWEYDILVVLGCCLLLCGVDVCCYLVAVVVCVVCWRVMLFVGVGCCVVVACLLLCVAVCRCFGVVCLFLCLFGVCCSCCLLLLV